MLMKFKKVTILKRIDARGEGSAIFEKKREERVRSEQKKESKDRK